MIRLRYIPYVRAFPVISALLAVFLFAPSRLMAQSGLQSSESTYISATGGIDSLWADNTYNRWMMDNSGTTSTAGVPVAAWVCNGMGVGCMVVAGTPPHNPEVALSNTTTNNAFLQGSTTAGPFWSAYAMPGSVSACGGSALVTDGTNVICGPQPTRVKATTGTSGNTTPIALTDLQFTLAASKNYTVVCDLFYENTFSGTAGGLDLYFTYGGTATNFTVGGNISRAPSTTSYVAVQSSSTWTLAGGSVMTGTSGTIFPVHISGTIEVPSAGEERWAWNFRITVRMVRRPLSRVAGAKQRRSLRARVARRKGSTTRAWGGGDSCHRRLCLRAASGLRAPAVREVTL